MSNPLDLPISDRFAPAQLADLRKSGLSDETIVQAGISSVTPRDVDNILTECGMAWLKDKVTSMLVFPYKDEKGNPVLTRYKLFPTITITAVNGKKNTIKYLQPKGSGNHLYIPPSARLKLQDASEPLCIVEGEKKALRLLQEGCTCVGISGIGNWKVKLKEMLIAEFNDIPLAERYVSIIVDNDYLNTNKPDIAEMTHRLADVLVQKKAIVIITHPPEGTEKGIDDYLAKHGSEAFKDIPSAFYQTVKALFDNPEIQEKLAEKDGETIKHISTRIQQLYSDDDMVLSVARLKKLTQIKDLLPSLSAEIKKRKKHPKAKDVVEIDPERSDDSDIAFDPQESDESIVARFNERYAYCMKHSKIMKILGEHDYEFITEIQLESDTRAETLSYRRGGKKEDLKCKVWMSSPHRRTYIGIEFNPGGTSPGFFNTWRGFPFQPIEGKGDITTTLDYLHNIIGAGDPAQTAWITNWLACLFQYPGHKRASALALTGLKGTGKSAFGETFLAKLLGRYYMMVGGVKDLVGDFNSQTEECLLAQIDESINLKNHETNNKLKDFIVKKTTLINEKYKKAKTNIPLYVRLLITAELDYSAIAAEVGDRRYAVFEVSDIHRGDKPYFRKMENELDNGGAESIMHVLMTYPANKDLAIEPPMTQALRDQLAMNVHEVEAWLWGLCEKGLYPCYHQKLDMESGCYIPAIMYKKLLDKPVFITNAAAYDDFLNASRRNEFISGKAFGSKLIRILGDRRKRLDGVYGFMLPAGPELRKILEEKGIAEMLGGTKKNVSDIPQGFSDAVETLSREQKAEDKLNPNFNLNQLEGT